MSDSAACEDAHVMCEHKDRLVQREVPLEQHRLPDVNEHSCSLQKSFAPAHVPLSYRHWYGTQSNARTDVKHHVLYSVNVIVRWVGTQITHAHVCDEH
jgi:hypothetical protein